jgi:cell division protein FtsN
MAKDYANRKSTSRQARSRGAMPGLVYALAGLSLGLTVAAFIFISRPLRPAPTPTTTSPVTAEPKKPVALPPKEPSRFSFYEMLPAYEVVIPHESKGGDKNTPPPIAEPGEYIIQVGSFRSRGEADSQKAKLALLGIESRVEQVTIDNKDNWFRVRIGPEKDQAKVRTLIERLAENSIQSYLVKLK